MKNWLKISLLSLAFLGHAMHAMITTAAIAVPFAIPAAKLYSYYHAAINFGKSFQPTLDNLKVFTLSPATATDRKTLTPFEMCKAIQEGRRQELEGQYIKVNDKHYLLSLGIPKNAANIVVHSAGYDGPAGNAKLKHAWAGIEATNLLKNNLIPDNTPVVFYQAPVNYFSTFSFGGEFAQKCLNFVVEQNIENNPSASIALSGDCVGATGVFNWLTNQNYTHDGKFKNIKAFFAESPSSSFAPFADNVAQNHVPCGLRWTIPLIFKAAFPNCKWEQPTILDKASALPDHIQYHIGYMPTDKAANPRDAQAIANALQNAGKKIEVCSATDSSLSHGKLGLDAGYQQSVRTFLDKIAQAQQA